MRQKLLIVGLLLAALGCNSDPRCRRETALLRAEILDLEDKYFSTKAQRDEALAALQSQGNSDLASKIALRAPVSQDPESGEIYYGEAFYEGALYEESTNEGYAPGSPQSNATQSNVNGQSNQTTPNHSDIVYDQLQLPAQSVEPTPIQNGNGQPKSDGTSLRAPDSGGGNSAPTSLVPAEELPSGHEGQGSGQNPSPGAEPKNNGEVGRKSTDPYLRQTNQTTRPISPVTEVVVERQRSFLRVDEFDSTSLTLWLEPRDASGKSRRTSGSLTVSIVDPFSSTPETPLGIWKFLPEEVELFFTEPDAEPGIRLSLPLEDGQPQGKHVVVLVRLQTPDGRALETTARIPTAKSKIKINQGDDDLLAEGEKASRPAWRPVR